jgi:3-demethylubiquinone-9 3-methyltransferase
LWFDRNAEEAVNHYMSIFKNSRIVSLSRYGEAGLCRKGTALTVIFELEGQRFWPSRKVRDEGMKKAMADPRLHPDRNPCLLMANASSMAVLKLFLTHECHREPRTTTPRGSQAYVHNARKICLVRPDDQRGPVPEINFVADEQEDWIGPDA